MKNLLPGHVNFFAFWLGRRQRNWHKALVFLVLAGCIQILTWRLIAPDNDAKRRHIKAVKRFLAPELSSCTLIIGQGGKIGTALSRRLETMENVVILNDNLNLRSGVPLGSMYDDYPTFIPADTCDGNMINSTIFANNVRKIIYLATDDRMRPMPPRPFHYPGNQEDCIVNVLDILKARKIANLTKIDLFYVSSNNPDRLSSTIDTQMRLRSNELIAKAYYSLYKISSTAIRLPLFNTSATNLHKNDDSKSYLSETVNRIINLLQQSVEGAKIFSLDRSQAVQSISFDDADRLLYQVHDEVCFVTSMFAPSPDKADDIKNISHYKIIHRKIFRFFFFTNMKNLAVDGWERVLIDDFPFRRMITQSRWPKFMAWQHPKLRKCKVVLYADANLPPKDLPFLKWKGLIRKALSAPSGIFQRFHANVLRMNRTITQELDLAVKSRKDIESNVEAQKKWLLSQEDFNNHAFGYWNMILVYNPNNPKLQELMTTFWAHYSAEDQSWRDQPLYRYIVHKLRIYPVTVGHSYFNNFFYRKSGKNKKNHKYSLKDDFNALSSIGSDVNYRLED